MAYRCTWGSILFYKPRYYRDPEFWIGVKEFASIGIGIGAWGLMSGVSMVQLGMSPWLAVCVSVFVYAGSAQLAVAPLLVAGAPLWVLWTTALCVNLRFVVFSAHLRPYCAHLSIFERLQVGYLTTDLSYVLFTKRHPQAATALPASQVQPELERQQAYLQGSCASNFITWHICSLIGIALASSIPSAWGLGFAGVMALVGILASMVQTPLRTASMVIAGAAAVAAYALPLRLNIVFAIAITVLLSLLLEHTTRQHKKTHP